MLKKENRLKKRKEFKYIYRKGTKIYSKNLVLIKLDSKYTNAKIGFSVSNKVGKAVVRNRIKRQLRAIIADLVDSIKNYNLIFVALPNIVNLDYQLIKKEVISLLIKGQIISE